MKLRNWLTLNAIVFGCMYFGFYNGIEGATNIALAYGWLSLIYSPFAHAKQSINSIRNNGLSVPIELSRLTTLLKIFGFIWFGHIVTGSAFALGWLIVEAAIERAQRLAGPEYKRALKDAAEAHRRIAESKGHESLVSAFVAGADWERYSLAERDIICNRKDERYAKTG